MAVRFGMVSLPTRLKAEIGRSVPCIVSRVDEAGRSRQNESRRRRQVVVRCKERIW